MRREVLLASSDTQIEEYGRRIGVDVTGIDGREAKVAAIMDARQRTAEIDVFGTMVSVPIRAFHDKRVTDRLGKRITDAQLEKLMRDALGKEQYASIEAICTDEDGVVDVDAMGMALHAILNSDALKNFSGSPS